MELPRKLYEQQLEIWDLVIDLDKCENPQDYLVQLTEITFKVTTLYRDVEPLDDT